VSEGEQVFEIKHGHFVYPTHKKKIRHRRTESIRQPVLLLHSNHKYKYMTENLLRSVSNYPLERWVVCFDNEAYEKCMRSSVKVACILELGTGFIAGQSWSSKRFVHSHNILSILKSGRDVISSDTDVIWLQNPLPEIQNHPDIDFFYSSDSLNEEYSNDINNLNCGVMYIRSTPFAISIVEKWIQNIFESPKSWDQYLLRETMKKFPLHKTLGLPVSSWSNGHIYYVQQNANPVMVHNTFTYCGIPGKIWRFMEYGLWKLPYPYGKSNNGLYLTYEPTYPIMKDPGPIPLNGAEKWLSTTHVAYMEPQLRQLEAAWNLAQKEGRTLILPRLKCVYDRAWFPHRGRFPGSSKFKLPFICPTDHVLRLNGNEFPIEHVRPYGYNKGSVRIASSSELNGEPTDDFRRKWVLPWCCIKDKDGHQKLIDFDVPKIQHPVKIQNPVLLVHSDNKYVNLTKIQHPVKIQNPVLLVHSDNKYVNLTKNMLYSTKEIKMNVERWYVALDKKSYDNCLKLDIDVKCFLEESGEYNINVTPTLGKRFVHPHGILSVLKSGRDVLSSDTDVVWKADPLPEFEKYPGIELFYTSDLLDDLQMLPPHDNTRSLNCGIMYLRATPWVISIVEEWIEQILQYPKKWDQNLLREILRNKNKEKTLGLPVTSWSNGHVYFVQHNSKNPVVIHNTFQYGWIIGKTWRFMENGLWNLPYPYGKSSEKYLTYTPTYSDMHDPGPIPLENENASVKLVRETHMVYMETQLLQFEAAWNLAQKEDRILILPQFKCMYERNFYSHMGRTPGSPQYKLPYICPTDHILNIGAFSLERLSKMRPYGFKPTKGLREAEPHELVGRGTNEFRKDWVLPWCCTRLKSLDYPVLKPEKVKPMPVLLMHTDSKYDDMTHNMLKSMEGLGLELELEFWLVSFDQKSYQRCLDSPLLMKCISLANEKFKEPKNAWRFLHKHNLLNTLKSGREVFSIDTDVYWFQNPMDFISNNPQIDLFYTSDALDDDSIDSNKLNCGIMYLRPTPWVISTIEEWTNRIIKRPEGFVQVLLRDIIREDKGVIDENNKKVNNVLGLPVTSWTNGHVYFVQHNWNNPILVHNIFVYGGIIGKTWRFMENGLWNLPYPYGKSSEKYLTYTPTYSDMKDPGEWPRDNHKQWVRDTHMVYMEPQFRQLEAAWNLAQKEGRILILPQFKCLYERRWEPFFAEDEGRWPGSSHYERPFECPTDHVIKIWELPLESIRPHGTIEVKENVRHAFPEELTVNPTEEFRQKWIHPWCCLPEIGVVNYKIL